MRIGSSVKSDLRVVLINVSGGYSLTPHAVEPTRTFADAIIWQGLAVRGFCDVRVLPEKHTYYFSDTTTTPPSLHPLSLTELKADLAEATDGVAQVVFGLSTTTPDYYKFRQIARYLRENYPGTTIVGGGPHFKREELVNSHGRHYRDSVQLALETGLVDAVNVGHAAPFIDFISHKSGLTDKMTTEGFYQLNSAGEVFGHGVGLSPLLESVPYLPDGYDKGQINLLTSDRCSNNCGYCSINKGSLGFSQEMVLRVLRELTAKKGLVINFLDSNPFGPHQDNLLARLDEVEGAYPWNFKNCYLDPSLLCGGKGQDLFIKLIKHGFIGFSFGREAVTQENAELMGRKLLGHVKTQAQLDEEKQALINFIQALDNLKRNQSYPPCQFSVQMFYIFSPLETEASISKLYEEVKLFNGLATENVHISLVPFILSPFPGTELRQRMVDYIVDPEDYDQLSLLANPWRRDLGPSTLLLDHLADAKLNHLTIETGIREAIRAAFHPSWLERHGWRYRPDGKRFGAGRL